MSSGSNKLNQIIQKQQKQIEEPRKNEDDIVQLVGFIIGNEEYAVPILSIQEIIKPIEFTRVPSVPEYVLGVFNLRGNVIPLIDLRRKFNLPPVSNSEDTRYIVMKGRENTAGFVIDRLTEAIGIKQSRIDPPPETIHQDKGMIYGIGKREDSMLTILKVEALLKRDF
ncbi:MAG TPA: chemotaxis protein CheW [Sulfurospirillum sp. UBA12182]|nr:MAG TPA: chemotaxis protein CheW [Sulfurospirillum sp. UBA12182]